ncbi:MAG: IS110 family transposase [Gammaproteobacteria bacterium]|nr:IS110 family transposase [Gammaproteobacteria bacterium]
MKLYGAIDLHSNNSVLMLIDRQDKVRFQGRLPNEASYILETLRPYRPQLQGLAVESTFNWYWLVDALQEAGYPVSLVNTAAVKQYEGLKFTDDASDARWLAHLLRLGILPQGYIYPKEERAVRDLLRKRAQMVRQRTTNLLSIGNLVQRNTGGKLAGGEIKQLDESAVDEMLPESDLGLAVKCNLRVMQCADAQVAVLERAVLERVKLKPAFKYLRTVPGIGQILALTIMLETGDIRRFGGVGNFASYCRCVDSKKLSNSKKKGEGNRKNGNRYLAWAYVEAANFAQRYDPSIRRFYQRKQAKTHPVVAIKTVAHKLARACYYIMRDQVPFDATKAFG